MKKLLSLLLALLLCCSTTRAESALSADELAYDAYLDITFVFEAGLEYLDELGRIWTLVLDIDSIDDADQSWFWTKFSNADGTPTGSLLTLFMSKYGYSFDDATRKLPEMLRNVAKARGNDTTNIIWAALDMEIEAQHLHNPSSLEFSLNAAKTGLREVMATDRSYPFLSDLRNYYKEAVLLQEYITNFKDNYASFNDAQKEFKRIHNSYEVDFEFIFDPDPSTYAAVTAKRAAEEQTALKAIYDRAVTLEQKGEYEGAIELYWECKKYEEAYNRIAACRELSKNVYVSNYFQAAKEAESAGNYFQALTYYNSHLQESTDYPATELREHMSYCAMMHRKSTNLRLAKKIITFGSTSIHYKYTYNSNGNVQSCETVGYSLPHRETYTHDANGNIISALVESSWKSGGELKLYGIKHTREYNLFGDIIKENGGQSTYEYTYDSKGFRLSRKFFIDGSCQDAVTYVNSVSNYDRTVVCKGYRMSDNSFSSAYRYTYNENGLLIKEEEFFDEALTNLYSTTDYVYETVK